MPISKCAHPECKITWESTEENEFSYCSIECAIYDGVLSLRTGWDEEKLQQKRECSSVGFEQSADNRKDACSTQATLTTL